MVIKNKLDKAFCRNLKSLCKLKSDDDSQRDKLRTDYIKQRGQVFDVNTAKSMEQIRFRVSNTDNEEISKYDPKETLQLISELKKVGFVETADWFFCEQVTNLAIIEPAEIILAAPKSSAIEDWRKKSGISIEELENSMPKFDEACYSTAGAEWLVMFGRGKRRLKMVEFSLSGNKRPDWLVHGPDMLLGCIEKDKKGDILNHILTINELTGLHQKLASVLRMNPIVFEKQVELLPKILCIGNETTRKCEFIRELFNGIQLIKDKKDIKILSINLVRLGSGILKIDKENKYSSYMECINDIGNELKEEITKENYKDFWILNKYISETQSLSGENLSNNGARQLGAALLKIKKSVDPEATLAAAARNLGMSNLGKDGEITNFNPTHHEDIDGGAIRNDNIKIIEKGWKFKDEIIIRAKVKRENI